MLLARAELYASVREFFAARQVLEVETPVLSLYANTDPNINSFEAAGALETLPHYLHTSPEFPMKRLLAAGSGPIYQICKVFRATEIGKLHNPEFSMLEWYRPGFDLSALMDEVLDLLQAVFATRRTIPAAVKLTYQQAFQQALDLDPLVATTTELRSVATQRELQVQGLSDDDHNGWLDVLFSHLVQPGLAGLGCCFITNFPVSQAALARLSDTRPATAARFEVFIDGIELGNGYDELADADELLARFQLEQATRAQRQQPVLPYDPHLVQALESGLPSCSGVAMGLDRLLMLIHGRESLQQVLAFPEKHA